MKRLNMNLRIPIRRIRRVAGATVAFVLGFSLLWSAAGQILPQKALAAREGPGVYSKNYLLINTDTGEVLAEYGADEVLSDVGNFCALVSDILASVRKLRQYQYAYCHTEGCA